jgi:hypothetical protein
MKSEEIMRAAVRVKEGEARSEKQSAMSKKAQMK